MPVDTETKNVRISVRNTSVSESNDHFRSLFSSFGRVHSGMFQDRQRSLKYPRSSSADKQSMRFEESQSLGKKGKYGMFVMLSFHGHPIRKRVWQPSWTRKAVQEVASSL